MLLFSSVLLPQLKRKDGGWIGVAYGCFWWVWVGGPVLWRYEHQSKDYISKVERLFNTHMPTYSLALRKKCTGRPGTPFECKIDHLLSGISQSISLNPPNIKNCMFSCARGLKLSFRIFGVSHIWITDTSIIEKILMQECQQQHNRIDSLG